MRMPRSVFATIGLTLLCSEISHAQFSRDTGPCTDLPEPGSLLETEVVSSVIPEPGGKLRYTWRITVLPESRRSVMSVSLRDVAGEFATPPNWGALSGTSYVERRGGAVFSTRDLDAETSDLKATNTYEFSAISERLPAPTLMIIYPRRVICQPTDEEWPALAAKGWTPEKLGRLRRLEHYTNRELVLGPVFEETGERSPVLFGRAMRRLADLHEYLAPLAEGEGSRKIPAPPQDAADYAGLSLQEARQRATERAGARPEHLILIEALHQFYQRGP